MRAAAPRDLRALAVTQLTEFTRDLGPPPDWDQAVDRWVRYLIGTGQVPDDLLETMPEVSRHNAPQDSPQEYQCGCVTVTRITDRDCRERDSRPFEMRLALTCAGAKCRLARLRRAKEGRRS